VKWLLLLLAFPAAAESDAAVCARVLKRIQAAATRIPGGECADAPRQKAIDALAGKECQGCFRGAAGPRRIPAAAAVDGPDGSGRFWSGALVVEKAATVCFSSSTVAWRWAHDLVPAPLPWFKDLRGDGESELIVWNSVPVLLAEPMPAALVPAIFRWDGKRLVAAPKAGRKLYPQLAEAYRNATRDPALRGRAVAAALDAFAAGKRCPKR